MQFVKTTFFFTLLTFISIGFYACSENVQTDFSKAELERLQTSNPDSAAYLYEQKPGNETQDSAVTRFLADYWLEKDPQKAFYYLNLLLKKKQMIDEDRVVLIEFLLNSRDFENALLHADTVLNHQPENLKYQTLKAVVFQESGMNDSSLVLLQHVIGQSPYNAELYFMQGINYFALNDTTQACMMLDKSISLGYHVQDSVYSNLCNKTKLILE